MSMNFSPRTTVAIVKERIYGLVNLSPRKQLTIFVLFFLVLTSLLNLSCAGQDTPTKTLSNVSSQVGSPPSNAPVKKTLVDTPPVYKYQSDKEPAAGQPGAPAGVSGKVTANEARGLILSGEVNHSILNLANKLHALAEQNKSVIDLVIDSPGGSVAYGLYFIQAMKEVQAKGVVIRCFVPRFAASMAFNIFTQCNQRYALPYAGLLFHAPRISGEFELTPQRASYLANGLGSIERELLDVIMPVMGITKETVQWFAEAYLQERMFTANELAAESPRKWLQVVAIIENVSVN